MQVIELDNSLEPGDLNPLKGTDLEDFVNSYPEGWHPQTPSRDR